jgi:hypothetical protein
MVDRGGDRRYRGLGARGAIIQDGLWSGELELWTSQELSMRGRYALWVAEVLAASVGLASAASYLGSLKGGGASDVLRHAVAPLAAPQLPEAPQVDMRELWAFGPALSLRYGAHDMPEQRFWAVMSEEQGGISSLSWRLGAARRAPREGGELVSRHRVSSWSFRPRLEQGAPERELLPSIEGSLEGRLVVIEQQPTGRGTVLELGPPSERVLEGPRELMASTLLMLTPRLPRGPMNFDESWSYALPFAPYDLEGAAQVSCTLEGLLPIEGRQIAVISQQWSLKLRGERGRRGQGSGVALLELERGVLLASSLSLRMEGTPSAALELRLMTLGAEALIAPKTPADTAPEAP